MRLLATPPFSVRERDIFCRFLVDGDHKESRSRNKKLIESNEDWLRLDYAPSLQLMFSFRSVGGAQLTHSSAQVNPLEHHGR